MTEVVLDPADRRLALGATGVLRELNEIGVLEAADIHVARRLTGLVDDDDPDVALAVALAVRAVRGGSVCVDLTTLATDPQLGPLSWPEPGAWMAALRASALLTPPDGQPAVLRLHDDRLLYLDRYWREEAQVCADLMTRLASGTSEAAADIEASLDRVFPAEGYEEQRAAARIALSQRTTVLTGGPGTGKTTTVAALLALLLEQDPRARVALAAPTGKAAARLQQAVEEEVAALPDATDRARLTGLRAVTLHRLLGSRPDTSVRFRHHRDNRLPHDVIVVDETSMISLTMMARLLEAVRDRTRLILVGDPDQLTSVEAGAVLGDLVDGLGRRPDHLIAELRTSHRFGAAIRGLAEAVRDGDAEAALAALRAGDEHVVFVERGADGDDSPAHDDAAVSERLRDLVAPHAHEVWKASAAGDAVRALALLDEQRLLCAHRDGPYGVRHWNEQVERWLADRTGEAVGAQWYVGRPLLVTANDYGLGIYNGDVGVCVQGDQGLRAHIAAGTPLDLAPGRLGDVDTMHAMTIHKSQGSQAGTVIVLLPPPDSRLLTRQLLYTAITRARTRVVLVGSADDVRAAVTRPATRATGLAERLGAPPGVQP
ncbi:exodeoxyribonuclease V subunit alpha [Nocardioides sp.]|uniref:exodeoxyribonuclease V subunit alpha n=1 Tax=Nocardioides sp. TaxID=35761 RepID=UPI002B26C2D3|nr:exodeoxyribonuclease V subunit alpha [Nocardioides sp.]